MRRIDAVCRSCGCAGLELFHELAQVPVHACQLLPSRDAAQRAASGALRLVFCPRCGFIQNDAFDPARLDYAVSYEDSQSFSPHFRRFAQRLAERLVARYELRGKSVLEIGCGKGDFLALLCEVGGNHGLGIDPAWQPGRLESEALPRLRFLRETWGPASGPLEADLVCCRHTLEHLAEPRAFVAALRDAIGARRETLVFCEVPDVRRVLAEGAFWDLYYEHCGYFDRCSLGRLFRASGFEVLRLARDFGDQYLLLDARPAREAVAADPAEAGDLEELARCVAAFAAALPERLRAWQQRLERLRREGRRAVLWGAGSKAVGFLAALEVGDEITCVVDINPHKQGMYLPGSARAIVAPERLRAEPPDLVIAMNPVYRQEIAVQLDALGVRAALEAV